MNSATIIIESEAEMAALAKAIAADMQPVDCITLQGTLGAGKTTFMRFLIAELQPNVGQVISPSFMLMQSYDVDVAGSAAQLWHIDGYRLEHEEEIFELGIEELAETSILCIEWPEKFIPYLPADQLGLNITITKENKRHVTLTGQGRWNNVIEGIAQSFA